MSFLRRFLQLFNRRERIRLAVLGVMLLVMSLFEVASIGVILPFIQIVGKPELALENQRFGPWLRDLGVTEPKTVIILVCALMLGLFLVKSAFVALTWRLFYGFTYRKIVSLSRQLLEAYLKTSYLFHLRHNSAHLVRNVTVEVEHIASILKFLMVLPTEVLVVAGLVVVLFITDPVAALGGSVVLGSIAWGLTSLTRRRISRLGKTRSEQHGRMIQAVNQSLGGLKEIKLLAREEYFLQALQRSGVAYTEAMRKSVLLSQYPRLIVETAAAGVLVGLVLLLLFTRGGLQDLLPILTLFGIAMVRLVPSVSRILTAVNQIRFLAPTVNVLNQNLKEAAVVVDRDASVREASPLRFDDKLELAGLCFTYPDQKSPALDQISLTVRRGQKVAFIGTSGAGKTTLVNLVLGLLKPSAGEICVDGVNIGRNLPSWQRQIGYIPQDIYLCDDTIRRNVAFGVPDGAIDCDAVWRALEAAQLAGFVRELSGGLDAMVGERGVRISAGQRQRIGIARALYHDPAVLVLDEATSALDNETERQFAAAIHALARRKTILIIAHRLTTVRDCDTIYLMERGRVTGSGTYDQLLATQPRFAQLVHGREPVPV